MFDCNTIGLDAGSELGANVKQIHEKKVFIQADFSKINLDILNRLKYIVGMMNRGLNKSKEGQTTLAASLIISKNMTTAPATKSLNDATIPLRVPSTLKDALQIMAEKEDRSLSSFIKRLLASHVEAQTAPAPAPAPKVVTFKTKAKPKAKSKAKK